MGSPSQLPRLYEEFAAWWPLLSAPEDYAEEADFFLSTLMKATPTHPHTLLELGSGGGNNASHLKHHFQMTLVDLSPGMLEISKGLNPDCEHIQGDMRWIRLHREYDAVFVHDAVMYMRTELDLRRAVDTAYIHCKPGGVALFVPDHVKENFRPSIKQGGHDGDTCSMRYLEWTWDPNPEDSTCLCDFIYLLRDENGEVRCEYDQHELGLFGRERWLEILKDVGFQPQVIPFDHSELESGANVVFTGLKSVN